MLRVYQSRVAERAKNYFTEALARADYYTSESTVLGRWGGVGAVKLGLEGEVTRDAFFALCDNLHPTTGGSLTPRTKANRTVGYDISFHCPKSVSVLYALGQDERLTAAFQSSVRQTMAAMEQDMRTRVRAGGRDEERQTGNLTWGEFLHDTARPVDGKPDPHLHIHCFTFNATYDEHEAKWKAGQFRDLKRDAPYYQGLFHTDFARRLQELGYEVGRTAKGWEVAGVPQAVVDKFSRRTDEIEAAAKRLGIDDPAAKADLGARTRRKKRKDEATADLIPHWDAQLTESEREAVFKVVADAELRRGTPSGESSRVQEQADLCVQHALSHSFERASVVDQRRLVAEALRVGVGQVQAADTFAALERAQTFIRERDGRSLVTTREALAEEKAMLALARDGRGQCVPLGIGRAGRPGEAYVIANNKLGEQQRAAVEHVLSSPDSVIAVRGGAGVGKTTLMKEVVAGIEHGGKQVFTYAPSSDASRGTLRGEGFETADTVAMFLNRTDLQERLRGNVLWIDEAGQLGARQMGKLLELAKRAQARVILTGDTRQHAPIERGDALRILETKGGIRAAEVTEVRRQSGVYREAVEAMARGDVDEGWDHLERTGRIREFDDDSERYRAAAAAYVEGVRSRKSLLVVSPTHYESREVTQAIRERLRDAGRLDTRERSIPRLIDLSWTDAQKQDAVNYAPGHIVEFHQNVPGVKKGERFIVRNDHESAGVQLRSVDDDNRTLDLPTQHASRFKVYEQTELAVSVGDRIRLTKNGTSLCKHRLNNGADYAVKHVDADGALTLANGWRLKADHGHIDHAYCGTSHAAQSKTVDRVLVVQGAASAAVSSSEQFYVSISRGRQSLTVFTDDKETLRDAITRSEARPSATELVEDKPIRPRPVARAARELARNNIIRRWRDDQVKRPAHKRPREIDPRVIDRGRGR